ncbi:MAG: hypothetical protein Q9162_003175 [Coniocarpon cinnabarinum]
MPTREVPVRYLLSAREQQALQRLLSSRRSSAAQRSLRESSDSAKGANRNAFTDLDEYRAASIRVSLRLFLASYSGLKIYDVLLQRFFGRAPETSKPRRFFKSPNFRLSLSLSALLFLHRTLHRFFLRLRALLSSTDERATSFRRRNPKTTQALTSRLTPAVGASASSLALFIAPADQTRLSIAIYAASRALEFGYNALPDSGFIKSNKPKWLGSWCMMPLACAQLLYSFVFDRECFPAAYGGFILRRSPEYIQQRPAEYPAGREWPSTFDIADALGRVSEAKWPKFTSPILFPAASYAKSRDAAIAAVAPVVDPAHPAIGNLSCALLHPSDPSCGRTFVKYFLSAFPSTARLFAMIYSAFALLRYKAFFASPAASLGRLGGRIAKTSLFITAAIGGAWSSICMLQRILPGHVMPTSRWYVSGFVAGLAGWIERGGDAGNFLYSARMAVDSLWKVGKKRRWWKGLAGGDVLVFWASMALLGGVYQRKPEAVEGPLIRKTLGLFRGDGWVDRATGVATKEKERELVHKEE